MVLSFFFQESFVFRQSVFFPSETKILIFLSLEKITFFQISAGLLTYVLANSSLFHWYLLFLSSKSSLEYLWRIFLIAWGVTVFPDVEVTSSVMSCVFRNGYLNYCSVMFLFVFHLASLCDQTGIYSVLNQCLFLTYIKNTWKV